MLTLIKRLPLRYERVCFHLHAVKSNIKISTSSD